MYSYECIGVIELGFLKTPEELTMRFLEENLESIASGVNSAIDYVKLQNFLEETQAQAEWLRTHGCNCGQGYLFARPEPLEAFIARLRAESRAG